MAERIWVTECFTGARKLVTVAGIERMQQMPAAPCHCGLHQDSSEVPASTSGVFLDDDNNRRTVIFFKDYSSIQALHTAQEIKEAIQSPAETVNLYMNDGVRNFITEQLQWIEPQIPRGDGTPIIHVARGFGSPDANSEWRVTTVARPWTTVVTDWKNGLLLIGDTPPPDHLYEVLPRGKWDKPILSVARS